MSSQSHSQHDTFIYLEKTGEVGTISRKPGPKDTLLLTGNSPWENGSFTLTSLTPDHQETLLARHAFKPGDELYFGLSAQLDDDQTLFLSGILWGDDLYPAFARLKTTGPLDATFGDSGTRVFRDLTSRAALGEGRVAINQQTQSPATSPLSRIALPGGGYLVASADTGYLLRLTHDGELDAAFANGGALLPMPEGVSNFELTNAALREDNVILLLGTAGTKGILASYDMAGQPIDGFSGKGVVEISYAEGINLRNLSFSADGTLLNIVGMAHVEGKRRACMIRVNAITGALDTTFNGGEPFHLERDNHEASFLHVASRLNTQGQERVYAVGGIIAYPTPGYIAAVFDKNGLATNEFDDGVEIGRPTTLANSMILLDNPPRMVVAGGIREGGGDLKGFVALHPLSE